MDMQEKTRILTLLDKYMNGNATPEEERAAVDWLLLHAADPEYDELFSDALESITNDTTPEEMTRARKAMENTLTPPASTSSKKRGWGIAGWICSGIMAAAITLFALLQPNEEEIEWHEVYAQRGTTERITLPDGTSLWLNSDTKVIYPSAFKTKNRTIFIDGEVYADVTPDPDKPFIMSASDIRVKVHGTQFSLKAYSRSKNAEVALLSGSVTVEDRDSTKGFTKTLKPGEMIRYNKTFGTMEEYRIDPETYGAWQNNHNIRFINQTLEDISSDLERRFDVKIVIEDDTLARTQYYASFVNNEGLNRILEALNSNNMMKISKKYDTIVISPK